MSLSRKQKDLLEQEKNKRNVVISFDKALNEKNTNDKLKDEIRKSLRKSF